MSHGQGRGYFKIALLTFSRQYLTSSNTKLKEGKMADQKIGRDAGTGKFIPIKEAEKRPKTTVIETIKKDKKKSNKK